MSEVVRYSASAQCSKSRIARAIAKSGDFPDPDFATTKAFCDSCYISLFDFHGGLSWFLPAAYLQNAFLLLPSSTACSIASPICDYLAVAFSVFEGDLGRTWTSPFLSA
jgi:hypothetical protein